MPELMITWKNLFIYKNWKPVSEVYTRRRICTKRYMLALQRHKV